MNDYKRLNVPSDEATPYLKNDLELSQYWEQLNRDCYGEILIDPDTLDHIGHVFVWHTKRDNGFIFNLEVKPQYRRQGYGMILLDDAVNKYGGIDLLVDEDNIPAIRLYKKYGFETIKTVDGQLWMKLNKMKQEGVIMFTDRFDNDITKPEDIDEMADYIQEGLFDIFKKNPPFESFEEMEEYTGSKIDPSFKKFIQSHNKGDIINYPVSKIDDDCRNMIEEYYGDIVPFKMFGQQYILKNEGKYRDIIELNDYCIAFAEIGPDPDGNLDPLCLWIATEKTKTWNAGTILLSEVINSDYPDDSNVFTKSFKEFSKNAGIKSEHIQEGLFDVFKPKPSTTQKSSSSPKTIEDVETMHDIVIDKDFKKFITENPNGCKFKYPNNKIVSKEILEFIDDEGDPSICSLNQFIDANCEYDGCIEICDYCLYIGGWIDDKALYLTTNKSSCAPEGSIIFSDVIENGCDYTDRIFAKSFKELLKNATFGKVVKESFEEPFTEEEYDIFVEAKISAAERNELEDDDFGLVYEDEDGKKIRKYPLTDKQHVLQAVRFFGDCPDEYKPLLAHNILKRAKKFDMDDSNWDKIHEWNEKYSEDEDDKD